MNKKAGQRGRKQINKGWLGLVGAGSATAQLPRSELEQYDRAVAGPSFFLAGFEVQKWGGTGGLRIQRHPLSRAPCMPGCYPVVPGLPVGSHSFFRCCVAPQPQH